MVTRSARDATAVLLLSFWWRSAAVYWRGVRLDGRNPSAGDAGPTVANAPGAESFSRTQAGDDAQTKARNADDCNQKILRLSLGRSGKKVNDPRNHPKEHEHFFVKFR